MKVTIQGEITERLANGFVATLADAGNQEVDVLIDSPGGQLDAALSMAAAVEAYPGRVDAILIRADSAALSIGMPADTVTCALDGYYLLHPPSIEIPAKVAVTSGEMRAAADSSDVAFRRFSRLLEARSGHTDGFWRLLAAEGRRLSAEKMVEFHLADKVSAYPMAWLRCPGVRA